MNELANMLVRYRAKYRLTQKELAKQGGVSTMTISNIERNIQKPNRVTLIKVLMVVGEGEKNEG